MECAEAVYSLNPPIYAHCVSRGLDLGVFKSRGITACEQDLPSSMLLSAEAYNANITNMKVEHRVSDYWWFPIEWRCLS